MTKIEKRYQLFGRNGVEWTPWFHYGKKEDNKTLEPWQLKSSKLKNEYRRVEDDGTITPIKISYSTPTKKNSENKTENKKK